MTPKTDTYHKLLRIFRTTRPRATSDDLAAAIARAQWETDVRYAAMTLLDSPDEFNKFIAELHRDTS